MAKSKIAITLDQATLGKIDRLVKQRVYPNRSRAIEEAIAEKLERLDRGRLARECGKLDTAFEKIVADEGLSGEASEWPEY